jgi:hypothetical protein
MQSFVEMMLTIREQTGKCQLELSSVKPNKDTGHQASKVTE